MAGSENITNNDLAARLRQYLDRSGEYKNKKGGSKVNIPAAGTGPARRAEGAKKGKAYGDKMRAAYGGTSTKPAVSNRNAKAAPGRPAPTARSVDYQKRTKGGTVRDPRANPNGFPAPGGYNPELPTMPGGSQYQIPQGPEPRQQMMGPAPRPQGYQPPQGIPPRPPQGMQQQPMTSYTPQSQQGYQPPQGMQPQGYQPPQGYMNPVSQAAYNFGESLGTMWNGTPPQSQPPTPYNPRPENMNPVSRAAFGIGQQLGNWYNNPWSRQW